MRLSKQSMLVPKENYSEKINKITYNSSTFKTGDIISFQYGW